MTSKRGFTLVELMVVILIFSILLAVILPRMVSMKHRSQLTACTLYERNLATALENYHNDYSPYYPSLLTALYSEKYINIAPNCPSNGSAYQYQLNSSQDYYTIWCQGTHFLMMSETVDNGFPQYTPRQGIKLKP